MSTNKRPSELVNDVGFAAVREGIDEMICK